MCVGGGEGGEGGMGVIWGRGRGTIFFTLDYYKDCQFSV